MPVDAGGGLQPLRRRDAVHVRGGVQFAGVPVHEPGPARTYVEQRCDVVVALTDPDEAGAPVRGVGQPAAAERLRQHDRAVSSRRRPTAGTRSPPAATRRRRVVAPGDVRKEARAAGQRRRESEHAVLRRAVARCPATPGWSASSTGTSTQVRAADRVLPARPRRATARAAPARQQVQPIPSTSKTTTRRAQVSDSPIRSVASGTPQRRGSRGKHVAQVGRHHASGRSTASGGRRSSATEPTRCGSGAGSSATRFGTATVRHPAASAEAIPVGESSIATVRAGLRAQQPACGQVRLRMRLAVTHLISGHHRTERARRQRVQHNCGQRRVRHGDKREGNPAARQFAMSSRAPGCHGTCCRVAPMTCSSIRSTISAGSSATPPTSRM